MDISALQTFIDVARRGSFAAVARESGLDPSSISRQIAVLEKAIGYRLFDRTTRQLALTEAGQLTFERIQNPLEELDQIRDAALETISSPRGKLRVTASTAFAERWLIPRLAGFRDKFHDIILDLVLSDARIDLVAEGVDVAIRLGDRADGAFIVSRLMPTCYRVVASPGYLKTHDRLDAPSDLRHHDCIVFPLPGYRSQWRFRDPAGHIRKVDVSDTLTVSNALAIRRAALEGLGVALLGDWTIDSDIENGDLVDLFPGIEASAANFDTAAWILYPSRGYVPVKTRAFIDHLRAMV